MCEIIRTRRGWTSKLISAALYLFKASTRADDTDKAGVMMIDLSVIMMTLVVINTIETVMVVNMSPILFLAVWY